ncbi:MAG: hypothetical protein HY550_06625 [Elusimicrobia bacterium]|nr:hypothetical protein [Elusimicrobiota bacterium]
MGSRKLRVLFFALAAAAAAGILAGLAGTILDRRSSALLDKYSSYRSLIGNRSPAEIKAALEKRGISVP